MDMIDEAASYYIDSKRLSEVVSFEDDGLVSISLTAKDWQMFWFAMDCDTAALALNREIAAYINSGAVGVDLVRCCHDTLSRYARFGAADSEGCGVLGNVLVFVKNDVDYTRHGRYESDWLGAVLAS